MWIGIVRARCRLTGGDRGGGGAMRILVAGAQGQLARALHECAPRHPAHTVVTQGRPGFDLLKPATLARTVADLVPDLVVNAAAYTAVDQAESEAAAAYAINRDGAGAL